MNCHYCNEPLTLDPIPGCNKLYYSHIVNNYECPFGVRNLGHTYLFDALVSKGYNAEEYVYLDDIDTKYGFKHYSCRVTLDNGEERYLIMSDLRGDNTMMMFNHGFELTKRVAGKKDLKLQVPTAIIVFAPIEYANNTNFTGPSPDLCRNIKVSKTFYIGTDLDNLMSVEQGKYQLTQMVIKANPLGVTNIKDLLYKGRVNERNVICTN